MNYSPTALPPTVTTQKPAEKLLSRVVTAWFAVAVLGQVLFAFYVAGFYGGSALQGDWARWNEQLEHGHVAGATLSNFAMITHLLFALLITLMGPVQFVGRIRSNYPRLHRWNGRIYVVLTAIGGLTGFYLIWAHEPTGGAVNRWAMSLEALLILVAGTLVWHYAVGRKMSRHRAWGVRLYLLASGVWFFRIMLMGWLVVLGAPVGLDPETFTGPILDVLGFAHYLLPLAIYELYLRGRRSGVRWQYATAGLLVVCTLLTAVGIFGATMGLWLPALELF